MKYIFLALIICLSFLIASCFPFVVADGFFSVSGEILNDKNEHLNNCSIELHTLNSSTAFDSSTVKSKFQRTFVVAPYRNAFNLLIKCPEYKDYKIIVDYGGSVTYSKPLTLGIIKMKINQ